MSSSQHIPSSGEEDVNMSSAHQYPPPPKAAEMGVSIFGSTDIQYFSLIVVTGHTGRSLIRTYQGSWQT
jgi:hypothetical protein